MAADEPCQPVRPLCLCGIRGCRNFAAHAIALTRRGPLRRLLRRLKRR